MKNKLSPNWLVYGKNDQKCFCLQMSQSNMESLDGKNDQNVFSINYTSLYMYLYPSIYPKYIPYMFQSEPKCEFICTKMIFRPLFDEIEIPIWLPKQNG